MERTLQMELSPEWEAIHSAWDPCDRMLQGNGLDRDESYGLCMVVRELLENAVKYGKFERQAPPIGLSVEVAPHEVIVEVRSPVGDDPGELREFDRTIQWIRGFQDPFEAYVERLKLALANALGPGRGGLGLARIAYEGRCAVDFYVDETNTLAVSAVWRR